MFGSRIRAISITAAVLVGTGGCDRTEELTRLSSQRQAWRARAALDAVGIRSTIEPATGGEWKLNVPASQAVRASRRLLELGLPKEFQPGFESLSSQSTLVPTAAEEQARLLSAAAGEIARTIEAIGGDGVSARVLLPLTGKSGAGTGPAGGVTVVVQYPLSADAARVGSSSSTPIERDRIIEVVTKAIPGTGTERVDVIYVPLAGTPTNVSSLEAKDTQKGLWLLAGIVLGIVSLSLYAYFAVRQFLRTRAAEHGL